MEKENNYETAKMKIIQEHLKTHYKFDETELTQMKIKETKATTKQDIFIYIAVDNKEDISNLYRRKADLQNDTVILRNYIPPQFYGRFSAINEICKLRRQEDEKLKTQVRFGRKDFQILIKNKGENEQFTITDFNTFIGDITKLPPIDFKIKWKSQPDRKPLRRINPINLHNPTSPAIRNSRHSSPSRHNTKIPNPTQPPPNDKPSMKIARIPSWNKTVGNGKRSKKADSMDSCTSRDLEEAITNKEDFNMEDQDDQEPEDVSDTTL